MKAISATDLLLISEFDGSAEGSKKWTVFDIIHPDNDAVVNKYLAILGFDLDYPIQYSASQHRNWQNKAVVSYMLRGEININRHHLTSEWSSVYDRIVAAAYTDTEFCKDLCKQLNSSLDYSSFHDNGESDAPVEGFPQELTNPDEGEILASIAQLEGLLLAIRGNPYGEDGSHKMPQDYNKKGSN